MTWKKFFLGSASCMYYYRGVVKEEVEVREERGGYMCTVLIHTTCVVAMVTHCRLLVSHGGSFSSG